MVVKMPKRKAKHKEEEDEADHADERSTPDEERSQGDEGSQEAETPGSETEFVAIAMGDDAADGKITEKQANTYAAKKTVAQGMMDIALITANANQLRYLVEFNSHSSTFYVNVFLITLSLLLQVAVGLSLIFKGGLDLKGQSKHRYAKRINNYVVVGVFLVTIINVFVASFTTTGGNGRDDMLGGKPTV